MKKSKKAFTLIELLIVIAIIGILASIVLVSLNSARGKARDAKRLSELNGLTIALELYFSNNNSYPSTGNEWWGNCSSFGSHGTTGATGWIPNLAPTYVSALPLDPRPVGNGGCYLYRSNGVDYMLLAYGTVESYPAGSSPKPRPALPNELNFAFYTAGASGW